MDADGEHAPGKRPADGRLTGWTRAAGRGLRGAVGLNRPRPAGELLEQVRLEQAPAPCRPRSAARHKPRTADFAHPRFRGPAVLAAAGVPLGGADRPTRASPVTSAAGGRAADGRGRDVVGQRLPGRYGPRCDGGDGLWTRECGGVAGRHRDRRGAGLGPASSGRSACSGRTCRPTRQGRSTGAGSRGRRSGRRPSVGGSGRDRAGRVGGRATGLPPFYPRTCAISVRIRPPLTIGFGTAAGSRRVLASPLPPLRGERGRGEGAETCRGGTRLPYSAGRTPLTLPLSPRSGGRGGRAAGAGDYQKLLPHPYSETATAVRRSGFRLTPSARARLKPDLRGLHLGLDRLPGVVDHRLGGRLDQPRRRRPSGTPSARPRRPCSGPSVPPPAGWKVSTARTRLVAPTPRLKASYARSVGATAR